MQPHIVIFDSGIGGTTVLEHIQKKFPYAHYSYVMDNLFMPYGRLSVEVLKQRLHAKLLTIQSLHTNIDIIVIACNTASTQTLEFLRQQTTIPIVGVVPAIKPAALLSKKAQIGLLATPGTIQNVYTHSLISEHAQKTKVNLYGSTRLVELAEQKFWNGHVDEAELRDECAKLAITQDNDLLVLGCTHFPILKGELKHILGDTIQLIDSGLAIANRVESILQNKQWGNGNSEPKKELVRYYATAPINSNKLSVSEIKLIDPLFQN